MELQHCSGNSRARAATSSVKMGPGPGGRGQGRQGGKLKENGNGTIRRDIHTDVQRDVADRGGADTQASGVGPANPIPPSPALLASEMGEGSRSKVKINQFSIFGTGQNLPKNLGASWMGLGTVLPEGGKWGPGWLPCCLPACRLDPPPPRGLPFSGTNL